MSLMIKGMDIPENCGKCPCCNWSDELDICCCSALKGQPIIFNTSTKCSDCPLVEIPTPHGDLIDRDMVLCLGNVLLNDTFIHKWAVIKAPAIIEQEE